MIFEKARQGDRHSIDAVDSAARYMGRMIGSVVNLLNLEAILIGGGVAEAGDYFIEKIRFYTEQVAWFTFTEDLKILPATLLNEAGILGAASLAISEMSERKE
jgi:glucokinase